MEVNKNMKRVVRVKSSKGMDFSKMSEVNTHKVHDVTLLYIGFGMTKVYAKNVYFNPNKEYVRVEMLNGEEAKISMEALNVMITKTLYQVDFDGETEWFIIDKNMDYTISEEGATLDKKVFSMTFDEVFKSTL